jgi:hypothetical protein
MNAQLESHVENILRRKNIENKDHTFPFVPKHFFKL